MSQWLHAGLELAGPPVVSNETRHVNAALGNDESTDKLDARSKPVCLRTSRARAGSTTVVIRGILHLLRAGCRWRDCPAGYDPYTTVYNPFHRWSRRRI